jgi:hypothetical protein
LAQKSEDEKSDNPPAKRTVRSKSIIVLILIIGGKGEKPYRKMANYK